jgi:hypothetical protein
MTRHLLCLCLVAPLTGCFGLEEKNDEEEDDDDGSETDEWGTGGDASDGADGGSGGGGEVPAGRSLSGEMDVAFGDGERIGTWDIDGETVECDGCDFAFEGWFTNPEMGSEFPRTVYFEESGGYEYAYTNYGEYWGAAQHGGGQGTWYTYSYDYYIYVGAVSF